LPLINKAKAACPRRLRNWNGGFLGGTGLLKCDENNATVTPNQQAAHPHSAATAWKYLLKVLTITALMGAILFRFSIRAGI
jgi:hypothetical protein